MFRAVPMRVLVTGAAGRIGSALCERLRQQHRVVGLDAVPSPQTDWLGSITDADGLERALQGVDAVVHAAALHAPQVGVVSDEAFAAVNVEGTRRLLQAARRSGVRRWLYTSTTALYGAGITDGAAAWVDEDTVPVPRTVYHRTKLQAEALLEAAAAEDGLSLAVLRMSRCFPEPLPQMAVYRLHRGIDARDVADAHACALAALRPGARRYVVSAATPFHREDAVALATDAAAVLRRRAPDLVRAFELRGWPLPASIDRVYDPSRAMAEWGWRPRYGVDAVLDGS
jgi:nucleoside-diphosphate-sugar epimerase